ncbi:cupin [Burkholderia ubonensis]|uniref:cupin domain-containing protein n=1 Tax=Burkholderia ubonensis TaxID=101571 RepID=UPI000492979F|nr:cupin domain-containing protein [Burkholderia ubonensis]KWE63594.1 cupin [Burkholderia ubonensis]KWE78760.1 cupin [Burkholderia ubonensis]
MSTQPRELLKAADIANMEPERAVHPLNGDAVRLRKSIGDLTGLTQLGVHLITLMPGHASAEYHRHWYEEEFVYVLSGNGTATIGEQDHAVGPGDFLGFARGGDAHTLVNTGDVPLVIFVGGQRLEHDVCDYPRSGKRLYVAGKREALIDLPDDEEPA